MPTVLRNIFCLYWAPTRLFRGLDQTARYGVPLLILVVLLALCGYALVASGLVDREVGQASELAIARWDEATRGEVSQRQWQEGISDLREEASFWKLVVGGWAIVSPPAAAAGRIFIAAGVIYMLVALAGRTPSYGLLVTIFVYAGYALLVGEILREGMMFLQQSTDVDTSLAVVLRGRESVSAPAYLALRAVDPFVLWFWGLAAAGVVVSGQLRAGRTIVACTMLWAAESLGQAGVLAAVEQVRQMLKG